jgi:GH15 family glucan-1,4-alpha-glucosidase
VDADTLYQTSVKIIKENQHSSGGFVACPTFPTYNYSWFRDGAYIAYAMDIASEHKSSSSFHTWAIDNILKRETEINKVLNGNLDQYDKVLHTRYTLDGDDGEEEWENFQLDGFGSWLWSFQQHLEITGKPVTDEMKRAVRLISNYLIILWTFPCYDCWEEFRDEKHIYTIASIYGGLQSAEKITGDNFSEVCRNIKNWIITEGVISGVLCKYQGSGEIDASLLGVYFPNNVLNISDPVINRTIERIQSELYKTGGLHRYKLDTYYGGGIWILLTAWLGIWYLDNGERTKAVDVLTWICSKADLNGQLAEQYSDSLNDESYLPFWNNKWGKSADPLLWSHAMYIILYKQIYP